MIYSSSAKRTVELMSNWGKQKVKVSKMNIQELVEKCAHITVAVEIKDLVEFGNHLIEQTRRELEQAVIEEKAESYRSPRQVSEAYGVDLSTLWRWAKRGYLVPIEVGGKRKYLTSDLKALLTPNKMKGAK